MADGAVLTRAVALAFPTVVAGDDLGGDVAACIARRSARRTVTSGAEEAEERKGCSEQADSTTRRLLECGPRMHGKPQTGSSQLGKLEGTAEQTLVARGPVTAHGRAAITTSTCGIGALRDDKGVVGFQR